VSTNWPAIQKTDARVEADRLSEWQWGLPTLQMGDMMASESVFYEVAGELVEERKPPGL